MQILPRNGVHLGRRGFKLMPGLHAHCMHSTHAEWVLVTVTCWDRLQFNQADHSSDRMRAWCLDAFLVAIPLSMPPSLKAICALRPLPSCSTTTVPLKPTVLLPTTCMTALPVVICICPTRAYTSKGVFQRRTRPTSLSMRLVLGGLTSACVRRQCGSGGEFSCVPDEGLEKTPCPR